jgi:hypothetical protein
MTGFGIVTARPATAALQLHVSAFAGNHISGKRAATFPCVQLSHYHQGCK